MIDEKVKETLKLIANEFRTNPAVSNYSMCFVAGILHRRLEISTDLYRDTLKYIKANKPANSYSGMMFFKLGDVQSRLDWLEMHINRVVEIESEKIVEPKSKYFRKKQNN